MELGLSSTFFNYIISVNTNDLLNIYLRYYNLLKKSPSCRNSFITVFQLSISKNV